MKRDCTRIDGVSFTERLFAKKPNCLNRRSPCRHCLIGRVRLPIHQRPRGGVVTQRSAKPFTPVQFRAWPPPSLIGWENLLDRDFHLHVEQGSHERLHARARRMGRAVKSDGCPISERNPSFQLRGDGFRGSNRTDIPISGRNPSFRPRGEWVFAVARFYRSTHPCMGAPRA